MTRYSGSVVNDKVAVHSSASKEGGNKIDPPLKKGTAITGDDLKNGWMHITNPKTGWVLETDIEFTDLSVVASPLPIEPPTSEPTASTENQPTTSSTTNNLPATSGNLYKVKIWGDPVMVKQGFDVNIVNTSNFQAVPLFIEDGSCGGVTSFLHIPNEDVIKLKGLQVEDKKYNIKQKMSWLCQFRGYIYMYDDKDDDWESSAVIRWGSIALGGNLVMVEEIVNMVVKPPDNHRREMKMGRLVSFRKTDWGKTWQTHPHLIHRAYCAYKNNQFGDSPKGIVYTPFWSPLDWDFVGTQTPKAFYLPMEWLEKQPS